MDFSFELRMRVGKLSAPSYRESWRTLVALSSKDSRNIPSPNQRVELGLGWEEERASAS